MGKLIVLSERGAEPFASKPRAKRATKKQNPQPELPKRRKPAPRPPAACELGAEGCEALRIHDWRRAKEDAEAAIRQGTLRLCEEHQKRLGRD